MSRLKEQLDRLERQVFEPTEGDPVWRRGVRILALAFRGFVRDEGFHHASALSFDTVLALVPLLVIVIGTLRGLGAYEAFVDMTIRPWMEQTFGAGEEGVFTLREAFLQVIDLGAHTDLQALGVVGFVVLLYLVLILLTTVETTLNRIWGARRPRTIMRRAVDYAAILFVLPVGLIFATALGSNVGDFSELGALRDAVRQLVAIGAASGVLTFLYLVMPHTRIRLSSAILGGIVAGLMWHGSLTAYATFQFGVARYNVLYSSFATLPLFLVWLFVSWLVVLFGAEVAAAHQDEGAFRWRVRAGNASARTRRQLGLHFSAAITEAFANSAPPPTLDQLARTARVPARLAEAILIDLVDHGFLLRAERRGRPAYVLSRDPKKIHLSDLLAAIDRTHDPAQLAEVTADPDARRLDGLLTRLESSVVDAPANISLSELVAWLEARRARDGAPDDAE